MVHRLPLAAETTHGVFSRGLRPALTVDSGEEVALTTLDAWWSRERFSEPFGARAMLEHPHRELGHALTGPIAVRKLMPGETLEVQILSLRPARHGFTVCGGYDSPHYRPFGAEAGGPAMLLWGVGDDLATTTVGGRPYSVTVEPFLGVMGMPPAAPGEHSTTPPRRTGGNLDCRLLTAGTSLFLPVEVAGGLLSVGDGHAAQGDGELSNNGIECAFDEVRLRLVRHADFPLTMPVARTAEAWVTIGLGATLDEAAVSAGNAMLDLLQRELGCGRWEALGVASVAVNLHVTQVVNGVKGVHAEWRRRLGANPELG